MLTVWALSPLQKHKSCLPGQSIKTTDGAKKLQSSTEKWQNSLGLGPILYEKYTVKKYWKIRHYAELLGSTDLLKQFDA